MKQILLSLLLLTSAGMVHAQYCCTTLGKELLYRNEEFEKGKHLTTIDTVRIAEVYTSNDTLIVKQENVGKVSDMTDEKEFYTFRFSKDGTTRLSIMNGEDGIKTLRNSYMKGGKPNDSLHVDKSTPEEKEEDFQKFLKYVRCEGDIYLTLNPKARQGDPLPESRFMYKLGPVKLHASITKGVVEGFESVMTPVGTFRCLKISYHARYKVVLFSEKAYITEWYAENVGLVKSVETDKKGKILCSKTLIQ